MEKERVVFGYKEHILRGFRSIINMLCQLCWVQAKLLLQQTPKYTHEVYCSLK